MAGYLLELPKSRRVRVLAGLSYFSVLCLVPLIFSREDEYIHFHARQGLVLWLWGLLGIFALHVPGIGGFFFSLSVVFISVFSLVGLLSVFFKKSWHLPVISSLAEKL